MARSSIYTEELAQVIYENIREYGTQRDGYERSGVTRHIFYTWLKEKPEFLDGVRQAEQDFRKARGDRKIQARRTLDDYLYGRAKRTTTSKKTTTRTYYTEDGQEKEDVITEEITKVATELCPEWVISRVLGKNLDEMEALQILYEKGFLPEEIYNSAASNWEDFKNKLKIAFDNLKVNES